MNVLSLFDGMSCGQLALQRAGKKINNYFASEIDSYAQTVTQYHFFETIQLGDVRQIESKILPPIHLLMGGSPCQGFSCAGKGLNFDDPRSKLFFEFVRLLKECKPTFFLLENVRMKQQYSDRISDLLGVQPLLVNSSLVSAQNRLRYYWTNLPITPPTDKQIFLCDILDDSLVFPIENSSYVKSGQLKTFFKKKLRPSVVGHSPLFIGEADVKSSYQQDRRVYSPTGKSPTLLVRHTPKIYYSDSTSIPQWRTLSPIECERLQTLPDNFTLVPFNNRFLSNTQRFKLLGNAWTVDLLSHFFSFLP